MYAKELLIQQGQRSTQCGPSVSGLNFLPLSYRRHLPGPIELRS